MLATESDRLNYLSALGITQYRARAPLTLAAPSLTLQQYSIDQLAQLQVSRAAPDQPIVQPAAVHYAEQDAFGGATASAAQDTGAQVVASIAAQGPLPAARASAQVIASLEAAAPIAATHAEPTAAQSLSGNDELVEAGAAATTALPFSCKLALWRLDDLFLLCDVTQLQDAQLQLLKNILLACGRKPKLPQASQFSWPLAKRRSSSFFEAREHFLGLLDATLAQMPVSQLLSFGPQALRLLTDDQLAADQLSNEDCQAAELGASLHAIHQAHRWPLTALPSLAQMLAQPARYKPIAWQLLQSRIAP